MPKARLTALAVDRFKPPAAGQIEYFDTHLPAFGLRVSYSGTKAWIVMTRVHGKLTRITLGRHPVMSLTESREKARAVVENANAGNAARMIEAKVRRRKVQERRAVFDRAMERYIER